jgi:hypothetical protein
MPEAKRKRFMIFISLKDKDYMETPECETIQEVAEILKEAQKTSSGYAVFDRVQKEFTENHNFFKPH